jgi:hypothetical protein
MSLIPGFSFQEVKERMKKNEMKRKERERDQKGDTVSVQLFG